MNRREFLKATGVAAAGAVSGANASRGDLHVRDRGAEVLLAFDPSDVVASSPQVGWAMSRLRGALAKRGVDARIVDRISELGSVERCVVATGGASSIARELLLRAGIGVPDGAESLALAAMKIGSARATLAYGRDSRGLVFGLMDLAARVGSAVSLVDALNAVPATSEKPANRIRSAMRMIASDVEDKPWFHNRAFWERYLTMLVGNRFNRVNLALGIGYDFPREIKDAYFYFAYPFLLSVAGYDVKVPQLPAAEREKNLEMLRFASDEAAKRGLEFQLGIWTHAYEWPNSPGVNYTVEGLNRDNHAAFCRDAVRIVLKECPNINGVTFRIHGESGVAEGSYEFWKEVFKGVATCGRRVGIDMHAKGMDQPMIGLALATGLPITISPKYWAEHMGLPYHQAWIRPTEMPREPRNGQGGQGGGQGGGFFSRSSGSRSFLRYGIGDLMTEDRKYDILFRMWPGTQRLLTWGDPVFAAAYGRSSSFCGAAGLELMEPLSFKGRKGSGIAGPRDAYMGDEPGNHDFDSYAYAYRLWGRLTYNPDSAAEVWRGQLCPDCGEAGEAVEKSLAPASRILSLITTAHLPSAANNSYWPEIYTNMSIVDSSRPGPYGDTPSPKRFGTVSPLDPQLFSRIDDHADELMKGELSGKYSPAEVAKWLLELADAATSSVSDEAKLAPNLQRVRTDVAIQAAVGQFFAHKVRAGVLYCIFDRTKDDGALSAAVDCYRKARDAWKILAEGPARSYASDITFGLEKQLRGSWKDRLAAIEQDIDLMQAKADSAKPSDNAVNIKGVIAQVLTPSPRPQLHVNHTPPNSFVPGNDLPIELSLEGIESAAITLLYRHVNQSESWRQVAMKSKNRMERIEKLGFSVQIPAGYTQSPFPLQYYFEVRQPGSPIPGLYPGFNQTFANQPYFVVRQSR
jgi:hypothetical protein